MPSRFSRPFWRHGPLTPRSIHVPMPRSLRLDSRPRWSLPPSFNPVVRPGYARTGAAPTSDLRAPAGGRLHPSGPGREPHRPGRLLQRPGAASTASRRSRRSTIPVVSNTIYPSSSNGLQTATGYVPWNLLIAQQFPWFGTLRLRGEAASEDVKVALAELAAAQLDVVEAVKRAYYDLYFNERAEQILLQNRELLDDFLEMARRPLRDWPDQPAGRAPGRGDAGRHRARADHRPARAWPRPAPRWPSSSTSARSPTCGPCPTVPIGGVPAEVERLYQLAVAARPELKGRLAAIARDEKAVELARKRYYPNITLGVNYGLRVDLRRHWRGWPTATTTSACSSASTCRSTAARSPPASARPRPAPWPTPSSTRPSATAPSARSRTC